MVGATVLAFLGALHFWWPKITGRMYNEAWGRVSAILIFIGFNVPFFPQFILGYLGMPRRYHVYPVEFQLLNVLSSAGSTILAAGLHLPDDLPRLVDLVRTPRAGQSWDARGLEWTTSSPPPKHNFLKTPFVDFEAYDYPNKVPERG